MNPWLLLFLLGLVATAIGLGMLMGRMNASLLERARRREERRRARREPR